MELGSVVGRLQLMHHMNVICSQVQKFVLLYVHCLVTMFFC